MRISIPRLLLHLEGLAVLVGACALYGRLGFNWTWFAVFLLAPDISMLGLLASPRIGAACYNAVHTYLAPVVLLGALRLFHLSGCDWIVLVWFAHIGLDRCVGYGLKYPEDLKRTHLQRV